MLLNFIKKKKKNLHYLFLKQVVYHIQSHKNIVEHNHKLQLMLWPCTFFGRVAVFQFYNFLKNTENKFIITSPCKKYYFLLLCLNVFCWILV